MNCNKDGVSCQEPQLGHIEAHATTMEKDFGNVKGYLFWHSSVFIGFCLEVDLTPRDKNISLNSNSLFIGG